MQHCIHYITLFRPLRLTFSGNFIIPPVRSSEILGVPGKRSASGEYQRDNLSMSVSEHAELIYIICCETFAIRYEVSRKA